MTSSQGSKCTYCGTEPSNKAKCLLNSSFDKLVCECKALVKYVRKSRSGKKLRIPKAGER